MGRISLENTVSWTDAPSDFTYPWGWHWKQISGFSRPSRKSSGGYKTRRMSAFDRKMLNRITRKTTPKPSELGVHPDQLELF